MLLFCDLSDTAAGVDVNKSISPPGLTLETTWWDDDDDDDDDDGTFDFEWLLLWLSSLSLSLSCSSWLISLFSCDSSSYTDFVDDDATRDSSRDFDEGDKTSSCFYTHI